MAYKDYIGCCGSCKNCDLSDSYTFCYTTKFNCVKYKQSVKADDKGCDKYAPATNRTNELIAKYDK